MAAHQTSPGFVNRHFSQVDRAADPMAFVRHLDVVAGLDFVRDYKRRMVALLDPREGGHLLDVGCGTGEDARALAALVGPTGRVVGIDSSATMIAEARRRAAPAGAPVEYRLGDCCRLAFADGTFDGCQADRVLHHLARPDQALREMARVARPGARVVVAEPDFETLLVDAADRAVTRAILHAFCDSTADGWAGRRLPALFRGAGLTEIAVLPRTLMVTDYALASRVLSLGRSAEEARAAGGVSAEAAARWVEELAAADRAGRFFAAVTLFIVSGRKRR
jgi:ubiquinone/menaquinone biosynthesis C-methylase UbiE